MEEPNKQVDIRALGEKIARESAFVNLLTGEINNVIVGQSQMVERLMIGLLGGGHILLEGVPGLAKTLAINSLAKAVDGGFSRIQFTPDLLPADVIGTMIYNVKDGDFSIKKGPVFANFVLADEINRAPAKVQSALLEAMQERRGDFPSGRSVFGHGNAKPDRTGRNISPTRSADGPLHAENSSRLPYQG